MKHKNKRYYAKEMFAGKSQTNEQNREDGSMLMESNAMAHMPQEVHIKPYPSVYGYPDDRLMNNSDNMKGIDDQIGSDMSGAKRHRSRSKY